MQEPLPTSAVLYEYRGRRYEEHHHDPDTPYERMLSLPPDWRELPWPDGTVHGSDPDDVWLSIGAGALDAAWVRTVRGRWRGCDVRVGSFVREGDDRGRVVVHYAGTDPAEADAAGFIGSPYQYWHAVADPEHIEVTRVSEQRREIV